MSNSGGSKSRDLTLGLNEGTFALIGAAILLAGAVLWSANSPNVEKTDFSLTYVGARMILQGQGHHLYDISLQRRVRDGLFNHPVPLFYEHPPFEALLLSPLAGLSFRTAYLLWGSFNALVWMLLIFFLRPYLPWPREDLGYLCLWLIFAPLAVALYQGQSSVLLLALYAITFTQLKSQREFAAGAALGLGLVKFQFVLPFALIFIFRKRWRFLYGFVTSGLILGLLSLATVGKAGLVEYVQFLMNIASHPQNISYGSAVDMPTLHGFFYAILGQKISPMELNIVVALLSILLLSLVAWRWQSVANSAPDLAFAAAIAASLLTGSHMFTHDFSPLLLAMFLAASHFLLVPFSSRAFSGVRTAMISTLVVFWAFPIYFLCVAWHCLFLMCPILLLFVGCALAGSKYAWQDGKSEIECVPA
jgi:glycosyl transferase family 87